MIKTKLNSCKSKLAIIFSLVLILSAKEFLFCRRLNQRVLIIECFIEDQAVSPSYDLAPSPSPPPRSPPVSKEFRFPSLCVCRRSSLLMVEEGGDGGGAKSFDSEKVWPL